MLFEALGIRLGAEQTLRLPGKHGGASGALGKEGGRSVRNGCACAS